MATRTRKKPDAIVPTLVPSSRAELERKRKGVVGRGPSGAVYRLRQINLERHALSGGLPSILVQVALGGEDAMKGVFEKLAQPELSAEEREENEQIRGYLDNLVLSSIIEPEGVTAADLGDPARLDDDSLVPPVDYQWIVSVAFREEDRDADGRRLWGVEPLDRFLLFRHFHRCAQNCASCEEIRDALSAAE